MNWFREAVFVFFLCFSGRDRMTIVQSILYHLEKFGLNVWYDNHKYILGDNKKGNYISAIQQSRYAIVIFSKAFTTSPGAIEELEVIKEQYNAGLLHVFPIFYEYSANEIPMEFRWLSDMIYNEINMSSGTLLTCNQIVCKYFTDLIEQSKFKSVEDIIEHRYSLPPFVIKMLENYSDIIPSNINSRLTILYSLFLFLETEIRMPKYLTQTVHYLFQNTKLALEYDFKEITLMEQAVCLAAAQHVMSSQE